MRTWRGAGGVLALGGQRMASARAAHVWVGSSPARSSVALQLGRSSVDQARKPDTLAATAHVQRADQRVSHGVDRVRAAWNGVGVTTHRSTSLGVRMRREYGGRPPARARHSNGVYISRLRARNIIVLACAVEGVGVSSRIPKLEGRYRQQRARAFSQVSVEDQK